METKTFQIEDIHCKNCAILIRKAIENLSGIKDVIIDVNNGQIRVEGYEIDNRKISEIVENSGYIFNGELTFTPYVSDQWIG